MIKGHAIQFTEYWEEGTQRAYKFTDTIYDIDELFAKGNKITVVKDTVYHHAPWEQQWEVIYPDGTVESFLVTSARMLSTYEWSHSITGAVLIMDKNNTVFEGMPKYVQRVWETEEGYFLDYVDYTIEDTQYHVTVYGTEREYGGPEEGGWWYNRDYVLESRDIAFSELDTFDFDRYAEGAKVDFEHGDIYSMAGGRKVFTVIELMEGTHETKGRPHYE